jgi:hypothetical protein
MPLRNPPPVEREQAMAQRLAEIEQRLSQLENARTTAWTALPFATNWGNYELGNVACKYSKDSNGVVRVQGLLKALASYAYGATVATLPENYRPAENILYPSFYFDGTNVGACYIPVRSDGSILIGGSIGGTANSGGSGSWISLYSITFVAGLG